VLDHYGMTETGPVAFQRTGGPDALHIIEESYFAEIIDPQTGAPVADGTTGELVLTPLGREASPLLRYRTGDLVRRAPQSNGAGFVLDGGILGRTDDMLVVRGVNIFPSAVDAIVRALPEVAEYRVHVTRHGAMTELAIEIESDDDTAPARLAAKLTESFTLRIPVTRVASGTLPRFELKARRWVR
jgi:phenylacetate-CoA ligase